MTKREPLKSKYLRSQTQEHGLEVAVIYCRVSSKKQATQGHGLQSQETRCREHARYKAYDVIAVFQDDVSGSLRRRSGMDAMLAFLKSRKNDPVVVLFDDISRLARDVETHKELKRKIRGLGCWLETPSFTFGDDADSELNEGLQAEVAQHMKRKNAERTFSRMRARLLNGYWPFQPPRGYKHRHVKGEGAVIERDEPIASILAEALEGMASGRFETKVEMKRFLEAQADYPKDLPDGTIRHQRIEEILNRVFYAGHIEHTSWDVSLRKGNHEPLVSLETFQRIQDRLQKPAKAPQRADTSADFPLRGWVLCGDCNKPMTSSTSKGRRKYYSYYMCVTKDCVSERKSIPRDQVHSDLHKLLGELKPSRQLFDLCFSMFCDAWEHNLSRTKQQIAHLKAQAIKVERQITSLVDRIIDADNPRVIEAYEKRLAEMEREQALTAEKQAGFGTSQESFVKRFRTAMQLLSNPQKLWASERIDFQRTVLKLVFLNRVPYDREEGFRTAEVTVPFRFLGQNGENGKMAHPRGAACSCWF